MVAAMKERPILFSSEMVRAILDGRKTQTRRVVNPQSLLDNKTRVTACYECPYGAPGGHLWVRETWRAVELDSGNDGILYKADNHFKSIENSQAAADLWCDAYADRKHGNKWRPSIFMPRWASRILLKVTDVRVERVEEISEEDAKAEGVEPSIVGFDLDHLQHRAGFSTLWDSINDKRKALNKPEWKLWTWGYNESDDLEALGLDILDPSSIQWRNLDDIDLPEWVSFGESSPSANGQYDVIWQAGDEPTSVYLRRSIGDADYDYPYSWESNPWVWVVSFKVVKP